MGQGEQGAAFQVAQLALNTSDMPGTLRFYRELFGFSNAGGNMLWGDVMRMQGLDADARCVIWWMVGNQPFFQLELFHHTRPAQRAMPEDWTPADQGWVRYGVRMPSYGDALAVLARWSIAPMGPELSRNGARRIAFRDPFVGTSVEIIEAPQNKFAEIAYVTSSVADIDSARAFYGSVFDDCLRPLADLHSPEDEALWGLPGATRDGFLVDLGNIMVEVVAYSGPMGRPRPENASIADQGIMNVGLGSRDAQVIRDMIARFEAAGLQPTAVLDNGQDIGTYFTAAGEFELLSVAEAYDHMLGFRPVSPFIGDLSQ